MEYGRINLNQANLSYLQNVLESDDIETKQVSSGKSFQNVMVLMAKAWSICLQARLLFSYAIGLTLHLKDICQIRILFIHDF